MNFKLMLPKPISSPVAAPQGPIFVRYTHLVMNPCSRFRRSSLLLFQWRKPRSSLIRVSPGSGVVSGDSGSFEPPKTPAGRNCGRKYSTKEDSVNCTTMCRQLTNSGKWKSRCSGENIHLLYFTPNRQHKAWGNEHRV